MSQKVNISTNNPVGQLVLLIAGDVLAMLIFTWVGRSSHGLSMTNVAAGLETATPFVIGWFAIAPWFGLFRTEVSRSWRKLVPRLLVAWAIGGPLALVLRALFLGRPVPGGIIPSFAVVALSATTLFLLVWRLGYVWWIKRGQHPKSIRGSKAVSNYRRPWWLVVNKPAGLVTSVHEESHPGEQVFIIRGEPLVQGLAWLTWGPAGALASTLLLAGMAVAFDISEQPWTLRGLFIAAFLGLPALTWSAIAFAFKRLSEKHLQAERRAEVQECVMRLNQKQGELFYRTTAPPTEKKLAYRDILRARVVHPIGKRDSQALRLTLETDEGAIVLLNETLGNQAQKLDLAQKIQQALETYSGK